MGAKIFIVDQSASARRALQLAISASSGELLTVGSEAGGDATLSAIAETKPDAIVIDVGPEGTDGVSLTERVMRSQPTPILVMTAPNARDPELVFRALQAGALDVLPRLPPPSDPRFGVELQRLIRTLRAFSRL